MVFLSKTHKRSQDVGCLQLSLQKMEKVLDLLNQLNQLTEQEKNQLSDGQKKALKTLVGSKPSVSFSRATAEDCANPGGLKLDVRNVYEDAPTLHVPDSIATPVASDFLCEQLRMI
jgi:hypothetical protein